VHGLEARSDVAARTNLPKTPIWAASASLCRVSLGVVPVASPPTLETGPSGPSHLLEGHSVGPSAQGHRG